MSGAESSEYHIRAYRPQDRAAVRHICVATAWMGKPAPQHLADEWVWAEFWTRYFTDREKSCSWVVESGGEVVGYLTGTADVRRFGRYTPYLFPRIIWRVIRKRLMRRRDSRRAILALAGSFIRGELDLPAGVAAKWPATFHFNLLPAARGMGLGTRLVRAFTARVRSLGSPRIHVVVLSVNPAARRVLRREGFELLAGKSIRPFAHMDPMPLVLETWVLPGRGPGARQPMN